MPKAIVLPSVDSPDPRPGLFLTCSWRRRACRRGQREVLKRARLKLQHGPPRPLGRATPGGGAAAPAVFRRRDLGLHPPTVERLAILAPPSKNPVTAIPVSDWTTPGKGGSRLLTPGDWEPECWLPGNGIQRGGQGCLALARGFLQQTVVEWLEGFRALLFCLTVYS